MLRYGNILDGLFHDLVVLCESEVDCRFYHAALDQWWRLNGSQDSAKPNVQFTDVGGKSGFGRAASVLAAFGIPMRIVADFDLLNDGDLLGRLCNACSGDWRELSRDWKTVHCAVLQKGAAVQRIEELRKQFNEVCGADGNRRLDQELSKRLKEIMTHPSPWADAKRIGKSFIPSGDASVALEKVLDGLASLGVHVVPCGEVECWVRDVGGKSMLWLNSVFARIKEGDDPFGRELLEFVAHVIGVSSDERLSPLEKPRPKNSDVTPNDERHGRPPPVEKPGPGNSHMTADKPNSHNSAHPIGVPARPLCGVAEKTWLYVLVATAFLLGLLALIRTF